MDFDPRWSDDPRDRDDREDVRREESGRELNHGSRGASSDPLERDARDPREVFTRDLDLPRGPDRERVWFREHSVLLRGSESRALATTGAFRVVHADDLRDSRGHSSTHAAANSVTCVNRSSCEPFRSATAVRSSSRGSSVQRGSKSIYASCWKSWCERSREMPHAAMSSHFRQRLANKRLQLHHLGAVWV